MSWSTGVVHDDGLDHCDNNDGADYRLWVGLDPIDAHVHARDPGTGSLGSRSLRIAISSAGMTHGGDVLGGQPFR